ncbi:MAG: RsmD family RNA methyltransferase [Leptospiraceae bacterium]|nr:RsmD family RNA methyltransferase [Leptospiraceae bacterium]
MEAIRIQQGKYRGRRIPLPPDVRGQGHFTPALIKEALFQLMAAQSAQSETAGDLPAFFDLCGGSGQMAFEAASRGYHPVHLCEVDSGRLRHLIQLIQKERFPVEIHRRDFRRMPAWIRKHAPRAILFLDPPFSFWQRDGSNPALDRFFEMFYRPLPSSPAADHTDDGGDSDNLIECVADMEETEYQVYVQGPRPYRFPQPHVGSDDLRIHFSEDRDYRGQTVSRLLLRSENNPQDRDCGAK